MVNATRLLGEGGSAARRQAWSFLPLWLAWILTRLFGLIPSIFLAACFLRSALHAGADNPGSAWVLGFLDNLGDARTWKVAAAGWVLANVAGVLILALVEAGVLRQLAAQIGRTEAVPDDAFAEGIVLAPVRWLVGAVLAVALKACALACALGTLAAAITCFAVDPGALAAFMMAAATVFLLLLPLFMAAADVGFARAVITDEPPFVAVAEGFLLAFTRASAVLPAWYVLAIVDLLVAFAIALASAPVGFIPVHDSLWILRLGPMAAVGLASIAGVAAVELWRLGVYTTLLADAAGTLPAPPIRARPVFRVAPAIVAPPPEPVLTAQAVEPEPVLTARAIESEPPVLTARAVEPEAPVLIARAVEPEAPVLIARAVEPPDKADSEES